MNAPRTTTPTSMPCVHGIEQALCLLELIADNDGAAGAAQLSADANLTPTRASQLLRTLAARGYLHQTDHRHYMLGARLIRIADVARQQVGADARPRLAALATELNETASLAMLSNGHVFYAMQAPAKNSLRTAVESGKRLPAHATASGKALLSQLPEHAAREILERDGMVSLTPATITDLDSLLTELAHTRARRFAIDDQEQEVGMRSYAVSLPHPLTHVALSVSGPPQRVDSRFASRAIPLLHTVAAQITDSFENSVRFSRLDP